MTAVLMAMLTFVSTLAGGLTALHNRQRLDRLLGYTAGVLMGVVAFEILPEIFDLLQTNRLAPQSAMLALVGGFLLFHIIEKAILIHHGKEQEYGLHKHPHVGVASALALSAHSFLDGVGIGLGFQAGTEVGITVAIAVIAHDFTDGLNTVNLMLLNKNKDRRAVGFLLLDAIAPVLGALSTLLFSISSAGLVLYLGFFAGFLLYIGASQILPEAHSRNPSYQTLGATILGVVFMLLVSQAV